MRGRAQREGEQEGAKCGGERGRACTHSRSWGDGAAGGVQGGAGGVEVAAQRGGAQSGVTRIMIMPVSRPESSRRRSRSRVKTLQVSGEDAAGRG